MPVTVRTLTAEDHDDWRELWTGYLKFYETSLNAKIFEHCWQRLVDENNSAMSGFIAFDEDAPAGLVHIINHPHCWKLQNVTYLQDLFVAHRHRGKGIGRRLIEHVYRVADACGCPTVYWLTATSNQPALQLYDRLAKRTDFIKYQR